MALPSGQGDCFLYVVLKSNTPRVMLELRREDGYINMEQLSGPRNKEMPEAISEAVDTWFDAA